MGSDFDNMMAKIIVTASTFEDAVAKCRRALAETEVTGVKTNLNLLRAIVADKQFASGHATTTWLEGNMQSLANAGEQIGKQIEDATANLPQLSLGSSNYDRTRHILDRSQERRRLVSSSARSKPKAQRQSLLRII